MAVRLCSMSTSLPSDLSSRGRQGSTVSDNTTGVTPIVNNVQLSLPAPSPVCDAIEDNESNDGASSVERKRDEKDDDTADDNFATELENLSLSDLEEEEKEA